MLSFLPVLVPIILIAGKSMVMLYAKNKSTPQMQILDFIGEPVIALAIGIILSFSLIQKTYRKSIAGWLSDGVEKAGMILAIIAAGGMFGEMLQATGMGKNLGTMLSGLSLGIFFPFVISSILKTAQGSSTVAVITTASLVMPMLPDLGIHTPFELTLAILSMGAGSMIVSHANDAYFWVISRFSNMQTAATLKVYTVATFFMGLTVQFFIWLLFRFMN